jgi:LCP family protein required for cell wall assembly
MPDTPLTDPLPSELEPAAPQPIAPQPKPRKKGRFWKGFGLTLLVLVGVGVGVANFTQIGSDTTAAIKTIGPSILKSPDLIFDNVGHDHVNILLIGQDRNWKEAMVYDPTVGKMRRGHIIDTETRARADTIMVCSLDKVNRKLRLVSFPRDTRVQYLDFDGDMHPRGERNYVKLNSVYARPDGEKLLPKVIQEELGIRIDRVAKVKLEGFNKLIDRVGGIDINVEGGLFNGKRGRMVQEDKYGGWKVDLMPGMQHLNAEQAHGYVRYRKDNEGDPGRVRRQQQVMRALAKKMSTVGVLQLPGLVTELQKLFITDMNNDEMVSAGKFAHSLGGASSITPITPFGIYAGNDIILNKPDNIKLFTAIFGSSFNPQQFLVLSPETTGDDVGGRNNNNPATLAVMREAGIIKDKEPNSRDAEIEAPGLQ